MVTFVVGCPLKNRMLLQWLYSHKIAGIPALSILFQLWLDQPKKHRLKKRGQATLGRSPVANENRLHHKSELYSWLDKRQVCRTSYFAAKILDRPFFQGAQTFETVFVSVFCGKEQMQTAAMTRIAPKTNCAEITNPNINVDKMVDTTIAIEVAKPKK